MSNWKRWPDAPLNAQFADIEHPDRIVYPELRDESPLILASDYSGEPRLARVQGSVFSPNHLQVRGCVGTNAFLSANEASCRRAANVIQGPKRCATD